MKNEKLRTTDGAFLDHLTTVAKKLPKELEVYPLLKMLREHLHMTQTQLSKLIGIPQSHIAKIESGKTDAQLQTLKRICGAINCDLIVLPAPRQKIEELLAERARAVAQKKVNRMIGTMTLEKQKPDDRMIIQMVKDEETKLLQNPTSELWGE